jgi:hypothetical protein
MKDKLEQDKAQGAKRTDPTARTAAQSLRSSYERVQYSLQARKLASLGLYVVYDVEDRITGTVWEVHA